MKEFLSEQGVPFVEKDVSIDRDAAFEMVSKTKQQGVPVIVMDDEVVIGFDRGRLQHIIENKIRGKPSFGLKVADATSISLKEKGVPAFGAYVAGVKDGSLATKMGLQTGDIITELNMQPIRNSKDIETAMVRLSRGSRIQIIFQRGGNILKAEGIL